MFPKFCDSRSPWLCRLVGIALVLTGTAWGAPISAAAESAKRAFDIPAETAEAALRSFAEQADTQFVYSADKVKGVRTNALRGNYAPREALDRLVSGTELFVVQDAGTGALTVDRNRPGAIPQSSPTPENEAKMKTYKRTHKTLFSWLVALFVATSSTSVSAQVATPATAPTEEKSATAPTVTAPEEETIVLSPFVVDSTKEQGSYMANNTLAGTRVRTDLEDVASALSVITAQFLQDTGANNNQDLLIYTPNTEVAGLKGNFSGQNGQPLFSENTVTPSTVTRVRGLSAADNTRDYFLTDIPWDSFNTGRIDIQRGPNSILFGVGSPGGIINDDINGAEFKNSNNVQDRYGEYGSNRTSFDLNYVLIPNQLAIRVAWVNDEERYRQKYAFNNSTRYFGALRYDPVILGKDNHTSVRVKFEKGNISSNNPRALPPVDEITPWFTAGKPLINEWSPGYGYGGTAALAIPLIGQSMIAGWSEGRTYWPDVLSYYNGVQNGGVKGSEPSYVESGMINNVTNTGYAIGDLPFYKPAAIAGYNLYARGAGIPGASYYADKVLTDPSIFNFFDALLDGPNEHQWQRWTALNASVSQTFFNDRLGFELVYDDQKYNNGQTGYISGENYAISVDVNETYANGAVNPNFGRPYVADAATYGNGATETDRHSLRLTGTAELRASDFLNRNSWLARILGRHVFTGLLEEDNKGTFSMGWAQYAPTLEWETVNNVSTTNAIGAERQFDWVDYIGPNLLGDSSASGTNLSPISSVLAPGKQSQAMNFNATWKNFNVSPTAPYSYNSYGVAGNVITGTQADNPANYVGWGSTPVTWLNANNPQDFPDLVLSANKSHYSDISQGFTYQGYMLDGALVPTFGWRKDSVVTYQTIAPTNPTNQFVSTDFDEDPTSRRQAVGETKAWGGVLHAPKFLTSRLPWDTTFSVYFDHNENFQAEAPRSSLDGTVLPNPVGKTKEYGFTVSTLHDKLTFKADWYRTQIQNATLDSTNDGGLGGGGFAIWSLPVTGYNYAVAMQEGLNGNLPLSGESGLWNYGWYDQQNGVAGHTGNTPTYLNPTDPDYVLEQSIVSAYLNTPIPASFFTAWGIHPNPINPALAKASGRLLDAFEGTPFVLSPSWTTMDTQGPYNPVTTVDTLSTGQEYELSGQPTRNWNITANFVRTFATHTNIDALTRGFMAEITQWFHGPAGQIRLFGAGGPTTEPYWLALVYNPYLVELNSEGQSAPEVASWRFNLATTYTFDRGKLKGYFVGGAARLEAGRIEGYHYNPTLATLDVTKPWMGPKDEHFDLWFGYQRRIFDNKINWRIQVNLHDVLKKYELVPAQYEPDGSLALDRIQEGMTWQLTNSFDF